MGPCALEAELATVRAVRIEQGRGRALRTVWSASDADVVAYMDVDLSTDLAALLPLVAPLLSGHRDVAIGTRLARGSRVVRGPKREVISRCYNLLLHAHARRPILRRAMRFQGDPRRLARELLPLGRTPAGSSTPSYWSWPSGRAADPRGAGGLGRRPGSRVDIVADRVGDLQGIVAARHRAWPADDPRPRARAAPAADRGGPRPGFDRRPAGRQLVRFGRSASPARSPTCCSTCCCAASARRTGANVVALLITAVGNTAVNRRFTFGVRGRRRAAGIRYRDWSSSASVWH